MADPEVAPRNPAGSDAGVNTVQKEHLKVKRGAGIQATATKPGKGGVPEHLSRSLLPELYMVSGPPLRPSPPGKFPMRANRPRLRDNAARAYPLHARGSRCSAVPRPSFVSSPPTPDLRKWMPLPRGERSYVRISPPASLRHRNFPAFRTNSFLQHHLIVVSGAF